MSDDFEECEECEGGAPAWLATFADLMSLLMCFFVLLLSFSEMDIQKYKQVAGSMKDAFGIQRVIKSDTIPRGTSVIKQEFSPGRPEPTVMKIMMQQTDDDSNDELRVNSAVSEDVEALMEMVETALAEEIVEEVLEIVPYTNGVMVRVREADAFPSGSAELQAGFIPVLDKLNSMLTATDARIIVAGHTDDIPISTEKYPSNWILSAARAAAVVDYLADVSFADPGRMEIRAFADTRPVAANDTEENRARNRRIEINLSLPVEPY